jgi:predicted ArsR family transcriptional regulator
MKCVPLGLISLKNNGVRPSSVFTTTTNGIESMPQIHHEEDTNDNILTLNSDYDETMTNTLLNKLLQSQLAVQLKNKTMKQRNQRKMGSKALPIRHKTRRLVRIA